MTQDIEPGPHTCQFSVDTTSLLVCGAEDRTQAARMPDSWDPNRPPEAELNPITQESIASSSLDSQLFLTQRSRGELAFAESRTPGMNK
ncbi:uncharacterized protein LOC144377287 isoform X2 [Ictidomys tridecemlineatus]